MDQHSLEVGMVPSTASLQSTQLPGGAVKPSAHGRPAQGMCSGACRSTTKHNVDTKLGSTWASRR